MPYTRILEIDRRRLVSSYQAGRDWRRLANDLGIKRTAASNIVRRFVDEDRIAYKVRGGAKAAKITAEMLRSLEDYISIKPTVTLAELRDKLVTDFPNAPPVSTQAISKRLDGTLQITLKNVRDIHDGWNAEETKNQRFEYMHWLLEHGVLQRNLIYMDECGCNVWTARSKGWAGVGDRAVRLRDGQRGPNLTTVLAVSPQLGLVHYTFHVGGFTADNFAAFVSEVSALVDEPFTLIMDNARVHANAPLLARPDQEVRYLPVYSPFLNPTEMAISALKAALKRRLTEPATTAELRDRQAAAQLGETLQARRLRILRREFEASLPAITVDKCVDWHNHALQYAPRCMHREDIMF